MGFSFRKKTTFIESEEKEKEKEKEKQNKLNGKRNNKATKVHPLAIAITDSYVDDITLYKPKITREQRYNYWKQLVLLNKKTKKKLQGYGADETYLYELSQFPSIWPKLWYFFSSAYWDQLYLNSFFIFLILCFFCVDRYGQSLVPIIATFNANNQLLVLASLAMFVSQLIPFLGTLFFVNFCYDLLTLMASREFQHWSFVSALTCQYVQYFFYSGRGRSDQAGKCRYGQKENWEKLSQSMKSMKEEVKNNCFLCQRTHAQVHTEEESGDDVDDVHNEATFGNEEGDIEAGNNKSKGKRNRRRSSTETVDSKLKKTKSIIIKAPKKKVDDKEAGFDINTLLKKRTLLGQQEAEEEEKRLAELKALEEQEELLHPEDYIDWKCIVCATDNHARQYIKEPPVNIVFGERGKQYKTLYTRLLWDSNKAKCKRCHTVYDYVPPEATAHLFPHNPNPYVAFKNYPMNSIIQHGLKRDERSIFFSKIKSFFYGLTGHPFSKYMLNDWKLKKYVANEFPPLLRYELPSKKHFYEIGEIIECKQQKLEWQRAKIIDIHHINHTYDIKYDLGDELRFVPEKNIRLRPEKRSFAYRMELVMVIFVIYFPLGLLVALQGMYGMVFLSVMITSLLLFLVKLISCIQYCYNYYEAGILVILRLTAFYTLPIFFLMVASMVAVANGNDFTTWTTIAALLIVTKVFALPVIYAIRASYIIIALILFLQSSAALVLLGNYAQHVNDPTVVTTTTEKSDGTFVTETQYFPPTLAKSLLLPLIPLITLIFTFKYLRKHLHNIWDVCFVIRPRIETEESNPFIGKTLHAKWKNYWG